MDQDGVKVGTFGWQSESESESRNLWLAILHSCSLARARRNRSERERDRMILICYKKEKQIWNFKKEKTDLLPPPTRLPRLPSTLAEDKIKLKMGRKWFGTETAAGLETRRDGHCCPLCNRPEGGINLLILLASFCFRLKFPL